jgi:hypothetical protein
MAGTYEYAASVQGVGLRITRLDDKGNLLNGPNDSYMTTSFLRVSFTPEYEDGEEITEKAADGTVCVSYKAPDTLKRVTMEIAICDPDPEITALMSGGLILADGGTVKGWASAQVGEDPSGNGVAVEVWSIAVRDGKKASTGGFFHWVFPYVKTRLSGDRVIENGLMATSFEGFGLGNINFRSGPDAGWQWPAATDRPYLYAREDTNPSAGQRGFFTYQPVTAPAAGKPLVPSTPAASTNYVSGTPTGINVQKGGNPYPYSASKSLDNILAAQDYAVGTGATPLATMIAGVSGPADTTNQANIAPTGITGLTHVQNTVTYLKRNP